MRAPSGGWRAWAESIVLSVLLGSLVVLLWAFLLWCIDECSWFD